MMKTRFATHLGVAVPDGWVPSEALAVTRLDGAATLCVSCQPALGAGADDLAASHRDELVRQFDDLVDDSVAAVETASGTRGVLRRARSASPRGEPIAHVVLYAVAGPWCYTAHASGPVADEDELVAVLHDVTPLGLGAPEVAPEVPFVSPGPEPAGTAFTFEELVALAESFGAPSLLGLDRRVFGRASREAVEAMMRTARRSLVARGVLHLGDADGVRLTSSYGPTLGVALGHDRWVEAAIRGRDAGTRLVWAARGDNAVVMRPVGADLVAFDGVPAASLPAHVAATAGFRDDDPTTGTALDVPPSAVDAAVTGTSDDPAAERLRAAVGTGAQLVRIRHLDRSNGLVRGDEATWLAGPGGARRVVEAADGMVRLEPATAASVAAFLDSASLPSGPGESVA
jgi:hypothetical protein